MMYVKTKIGPSKINGIGLFADEFIPKETVIWKFNPLIDLCLSKSDLRKLSLASQEQLHKYTYLDSNKKKYVLCGDDARFFNHSKNPNCKDVKTYSHDKDDKTIAIKDIKKGEELTCDYHVFYGNIKEHPEVK